MIENILSILQPPNIYKEYLNTKRGIGNIIQEQIKDQNYWDMEYPKSWLKIREEIKERDNNTCQLCNTKITGRYAVHHINYDKTDCRNENLILLCSRCHGKTNGTQDNRLYWTAYFQGIMSTRISNIKIPPKPITGLSINSLEKGIRERITRENLQKEMRKLWKPTIPYTPNTKKLEEKDIQISKLKKKINKTIENYNNLYNEWSILSKKEDSISIELQSKIEQNQYLRRRMERMKEEEKGLIERKEYWKGKYEESEEIIKRQNNTINEISNKFYKTIMRPLPEPSLYQRLLRKISRS